MRAADTVIVPAAVEDYRPQRRGRLSPLVRAALAEIPPAARLASICTGSFVLRRPACSRAAGRPRTGSRVPNWPPLYPGIDVGPDMLYTDDNGVLTSAGVAAGIDLCLHMIRGDHGADVAM